MNKLNYSNIKTFKKLAKTAQQQNACKALYP